MYVVTRLLKHDEIWTSSNLGFSSHAWLISNTVTAILRICGIEKQDGSYRH
jgi:hypothetical protein